MERGKFIVFEGIDGSGKDEQHERLSREIFRDHKANLVFSTREPNELDEYGIKTRYMLKGDENPLSNALRDARGYSINRSTHNSLFNPLLESGIHVISNRYWHSTFAYQHAQGLKYEYIAELNKGLTVPDITLFLDVDIDEAFRRISYDETRVKERFEREDFLRKVRDNYLELPEILPELIGDNSIKVIDANGSRDEVWKNVCQTLKNDDFLIN